MSIRQFALLAHGHFLAACLLPTAHAGPACASPGHLAAPVQRQALATDVYRINCGGTGFVDAQGNSWLADFGYNTGNTSSTSQPIAKTVNDELYQTERWDSSSGAELNYSLPVTPNRRYLVRLHFAEIYGGIDSPGDRVFNVVIDGVPRLTNFDQFLEAGGSYTALVRQLVVVNTDGVLDITMEHVSQNPAIKAIHVVEQWLGPFNRPPVINSTPRTSGTDGVSYNYDVDAHDPNIGDQLTFSLPSSPSGAAVDPVSGLISWTPSSQVGLHPFVVRATDTGGLFSDQAFAVEVSYRIHCGSFGSYTDAGGNEWTPDLGYVGGTSELTSQSITGTPDPELYQRERRGFSGGADLGYGLPVPAGSYSVRLHFAETAPSNNGPGLRVFDVALEGALVVDDFDIYAAAGGAFAATQLELHTNVSDGTLNLDLIAGLQSPSISAIEVLLQGELDISPATLSWGHVPIGQDGGSQRITLQNMGSSPTTISTLSFNLLEGHAGHDFEVDLAGEEYSGDHDSVSHSVNVTLQPGQVVSVPVSFHPHEPGETILDLEFAGSFATTAVRLSGTGGGGAGYLHVVITAPEVVVDYDGDGGEDVTLQGHDSHTHELGQEIILHEWEENGVLFASVPDVIANFNLGPHIVELTIGDDATPQKFLTDTHAFDVVPIDQVPGGLVMLYFSGSQPPAALLDSLPASPDHAMETADLTLVSTEPFGANVLVRFLVEVAIQIPGNYEFLPTYGGTDTRVLVNGALTSGSVFLGRGIHTLDARLAVSNAMELPIEVKLSQEGGAADSIDPGLLSHDFTSFGPVSNSMSPGEGSETGGNLVIIEGIGFFPSNQVFVQWGQGVLTSGLTVTPSSIQFFAPPGSGVVDVAVITPQGVSNARTFSYSPGGPLPIIFDERQLLRGLHGATTAAWGPDERLYVGTESGVIHVITVDDDYQVISTSQINSIANLSNHNLLGIAFNPFDPPSPVRIYVGHSQLFLDGGGCLTGAPVPYQGQISVLEGPNFDTVTELVTGLPVSNHDHGVNGIDFDRNGDLYVNIGSNTNAGIPDCASGGLPESPLSGATLKVELSRADFNGALSYEELFSGVLNNDQADGEEVELVPGTHVTVFGAGLRNAYDLVYTTRDQLYVTDNGPNSGYGPAATLPCFSGGMDPDEPDELNLVEFGQYYGHPNCNRSRLDEKQGRWQGVIGPSLPGEFTQTLMTFPPSTNGIVEYRANCFNGAMRGDLITQKYESNTYRVTLSESGRSVVSSSEVPTVYLSALDVITGPGGVLIGVDHSDNTLLISEPQDPGSLALQVIDVFPWRAPASGGHPFVISGSHFGGQIGNVTVTFDGVTAALTSVSDNRIRGTVPAHSSAPSELVHIVVAVSGELRVLAHAFRFLQPAGSEPWSWRRGAEMPEELGEVAGGIIDGVYYIVGEGDHGTFAYDIAGDSWSARAERPFAGHHHAAVTHGGKLYLFGGIGHGSSGGVQIYDPLADTWTLGAAMPWSGGSSSAALVGSLVYVCGGIVGSSTVDNLAAYDPVSDSWGPLLASMPAGRNHAAAATDGTKLYVFGGRVGGNSVANGFDDTQVYDPSSNTWQTSAGSGSLAPLPQARGGLGVAVYYDGEIYVMGGETSNGPGATPEDVYDRVDIYDPVENSWRVGSPMPTARHGIYPVLDGKQIYVPGGGIEAAASASAIVEIYAL